ncbi:hypothetical protein BOSEA31B_20354 [Hyphomicrobiales bacterium]|nr:hypothetical protein BOSEA31B_20354 [Hyphomicrobiales bacterium]CAH1702270.1 hypothetical protein BOSEA1005_30142 [Hyphomicrobiales bacterium]CAI0346473.1 hypothetical protein BO1005MUT1_510114 [Hyphomicrobiales bacterium]
MDHSRSDCQNRVSELTESLQAAAMGLHADPFTFAKSPYFNPGGAVLRSDGAVLQSGNAVFRSGGVSLRD